MSIPIAMFNNPALMHQLDQLEDLPLPGPFRTIVTGIEAGDMHNYGNLPGVKCPTCDAAGKESWVIPGKRCATCGTDC